MQHDKMIDGIREVIVFDVCRNRWIIRHDICVNGEVLVVTNYIEPAVEKMDDELRQKSFDEYREIAKRIVAERGIQLNGATFQTHCLAG